MQANSKLSLMLLALAACLGAPRSAWAEARAPMEVSKAQLVLTGGSQRMGTLHLNISNPSSTPDELLRVSIDGAETVTLHNMSAGEMHSQQGIAIGARSRLSLADGSTHIMVEGVRPGLHAGATVNAKLAFRHAGTVLVPAAVLAKPQSHGQH